MMKAWQDLVKFLQCVSRTHLTQAELDHALRFVNEEVPWDNIVALAGIQGVDGFLYYHMKNLGLLHLFPKSVLGRLEGTYAKTRKHTLAVLSEAEALSLLFEQARIPVMALQGLSLITTVYGEPGLRQLGDIDLMVKPNYKKDLKELLCHAGYRSPYPTYPDLLYKADVVVDIHTHILNLERIQSRRYLFPENLTPMWEMATPLFSQRDGLLILDPCDNFVALAAHALKHSYSRLIWLTDLHECILKWASTTYGWERMAERAQFWHQERVVLCTLILVERIFDLKVPFWVKSELGIHNLNILEKHLLRLRLRGFSSDELCIALWLCNIKGAGKKLKFLKETVFPKDEIMAQIFGKSSKATKPSVCAKRIKQSIIIVGENLHRALALSLRSGGNE